MKGMGSDPARDRFFKTVLGLLVREQAPYLIGGGYAFARYTDIHRDTKDLDLFIKPGDCDGIIALARNAGYKAYVKSKHWLGKIESGDYFVDLIYSSGNGACIVDNSWFKHAQRSTLLGRKVGLVAPEEIIWSKAFIMERHRYDGADVAHLFLSQARALDWNRLVKRFGDQWPVLLSHMILFRFIYPQRAADIPEDVFTMLVNRFSRGLSWPERGKICRGTLLSFCEYLPDIKSWGYRDARLLPTGSLSQAEIDIWTAESK